MVELQYTPVEEIEEVRLSWSSVSRFVTDRRAADPRVASSRLQVWQGEGCQISKAPASAARVLTQGQQRPLQRGSQTRPRSFLSRERDVRAERTPSPYSCLIIIHYDLVSNITSPLNKSSTSSTTLRNGPNQRARSSPSTLVQSHRSARSQKGLCLSSCHSITLSCS